MDFFDSWRISLYTEAIQHCQQSFSARMQIPGRGVAFVQRLDQVHEPMEAELRDGLVKIQQVYDQTMANICDGMAMGGGVGGGIGAIFFGIACAAAGPGAWGVGALFGGVFGGTGGFVIGGVSVKAMASKTRLKSLEALYKREVEFVTINIPAIKYHMQQHPEDNLQLQPLSTHFDWVLTRAEAIEKECFERQKKESIESIRREDELSKFNVDQSCKRSSYCAVHTFDPSAYTTAQTLYPNRTI